MKKEVWLKYMGVFVILALTLYNIRDLDMIHVLHDEYGYWASAAFFAGKDWSAVTSYTSYYSYGYGFLLAPLTFFMNNASYMYKAAIVLNALMLTASYFIAITCIRRLFKDIQPIWVYIIALVCTIYSNNLIQAQITWSETLLYLLFWIITWLLISLYEEPKIWKLVAMAITTVYSYMVHQRSLGVVVAVLIIIAIMKMTKRISWKQILIFTVAFVVMIVLHVYLKDLVKTELYLDGVIKSMNANDFGGQTSKITAIFTSIDGFIRALVGFLGKTFYLSAGTFGIMIVGIYYSLKKMIKHENDLITYVCSLGFMSVFFSLGINTVFMLYGSRLDCVIYGRYTEFVVGPMLAMGCAVLYKQLIQLKELISLYALTIAAAIAVAVYMQHMDTLNYNSICAVSLYLFFRGITNRIQPFIRMVPVLLTVFGLFALFYHVRQRETKEWFMTLCLSISGIFWITTSIYLAPLLEVYDFKEIQNIPQLIEQYSDDENIRIEYITDKNDIDSRFIEYFRFLMPDAEINYHPLEQLTTYDKNAWILRNTQDEFYMLDEYHIVARWDTMELLIKKDHPSVERMNQDNIFYYGKDNTLFFTRSDVMSQNQDDDAIEWKSNGTEGYFVYGPYMMLGEGEYQLEIDLSVLINADKKIESPKIHVDVYNSGEILGEKYIEQEGRTMLKLPFVIKEEKDSVEFRIKVNENVIVKIEQFKIIKLNGL